jgi:hypothetical protein
VRESEKSEEFVGTKPNEHLDRVWGDEIATTDDAGRTGEKNERTAALPNSEATAKER